MSQQKTKQEDEQINVDIVEDTYVISTNNNLSLVSSGLTDTQKAFLLGKTPGEHIYKRQGKGNQSFEYVTGVYVKKVLNFVFNWNWDFEVLNEWEYPRMSETPDTIIAKGKLTAKVFKNNKEYSIVKTQYGRADVKYLKDSQTPVSIGDDFKAAATDALKKCAAELGVASDVYGGNEFKDIEWQVSKKDDEQEQKVSEAIRSLRKAETLDDLKERFKALNNLMTNKQVIVAKDERKQELENQTEEAGKEES